ncbi:glycosyltransferase family 4 protein, partial [bacterium]|nr:glycosyltransferase family 4 protein [bacterium]
LLGVIARLSPEKGHRFFMEAFAKIHTDFPKAKLIIAGPDASEQTSDDLSEYSKTLGITDKVIFTGKVDDVREVITELTLGVIPSLRSEAICRVALEYMTWGIPIVATDVNILPEVVRDGVNGWTVPVGNVEAMAKALQNALENSVEREKRGVQGKELLNGEFSRAQMVQRTLAFYNEVSVSR